MKIILPIPHRSLSPNSRNHWAVVAKHKKILRVVANAECRHALKTAPPLWTKASVKILWVTKTKRQPDPDNCVSMCKAIFDGIQDAGVVSNDRGLRIEPVDFAVDRKNPRVEITIEPI